MPYTKIGPFTNNAATPPIDNTFLDGVEGGLDAAVNRRGFVSVTEYGAKLDGTTDDTAAIQAAINTGADVLIAGTSSGVAKARTTATLVGKASAPWQRIVTHNAQILPAFLGDVIQMTATSAFQVDIRGDLQPSTGDYSNVAAIRIGGTTAQYNPQHGSVAYSNVQNFKGSAVIWEGGSMIDFTHFHADTVSVDGIRCTNEAGPDNNHGWFANTHIVNATGRGYAVLGDGTNMTAGGSRHHVFADAKAFGCNPNFYIQSRSNGGRIFSEVGTSADTFTSTSRGNDFQYHETAASFESCVDQGLGNEISGYSGNNVWETKSAIVRKLTVGGAQGVAGTAFSQVISGEYTIPTATIAAGAVSSFPASVSGLGTGRAVHATMFGSLPAGILVQPYIDAGANLNFTIVNQTGATQTLTGNVISYVIWRFA